MQRVFMLEQQQQLAKQMKQYFNGKSVSNCGPPCEVVLLFRLVQTVENFCTTCLIFLPLVHLLLTHFVLFFRHYIEATRNMQNYHRLFWASQERYDKLVNLSSSGGAAGFRTVDVPEGSDTVFEAANALADFNKNGVHKNGETELAPQVDSGIDIGGDVQANGGLGSSTRSSEQNGGSKHESNSSPGISRRQRTLKPVTDKSTSKGSVEKSSSSRQDKPSPNSKTSTEKTPNGRTIVEKTNANSSTSNSHVFAVPKPPGPRKGARRQLHVDFAVSSKPGTSTGTTTSTTTHGVTSSGISASGISEAQSRRTQSRLVVLVRRPFPSSLLPRLQNES